LAPFGAVARERAYSARYAGARIRGLGREGSATYSIRTAAEGALFIGAREGDPVADAYAFLLRAGATRPEWCFVLERNGSRVGQVGFRVAETCPPEFLGDLPARELYLFGLEPPPDGDWLGGGRALLGEALDRVHTDVPEVPQARFNTEVHDHVDRLRAIVEAAGMTVFQEKHGYFWQDDGRPTRPPDRLRYRTVAQVGRKEFQTVLGRVGAGTLDRNDAWYRRLAGEANWSAVFMTFLAEQDATTWLLAERPDGDRVGIVAVSAFDEPNTATIVFIGVVPEHRGHRYADDLILAGTAAARATGYTAILSDVDVLNAPMAAAFERTGHRGDARPWHIWHYRR